MIVLFGLAFAADPTCYAVDGATVYLPAGPKSAFLLVDGDHIAIAGDRPADVTVANASVNYKGRSCPIIAGAGDVVTAGLTAVDTVLGVDEIDLEDATTDQDEGGDPVRASLVVVDAYNPRSVSVPVARIGGITSAIVEPSGGLVSGASGWVDLRGTTQEASVVRRVLAMRMGYGTSPSRAGSYDQLRELFDTARRYQANKANWRATETLPDGVSFADLDALDPVLRGDIPIVFGADRAADIEALVRLAAEQKVRLVLDGGAEAWTLADKLAAAKVPVIVDPFVYGPGGFDQVLGRPDNAALLVKAGVTVLITDHQTQNVRTLRQVAGNAVRGGMSHDDAMRAITVAPASVFGIKDHGVLSVGAKADVVVWTGDPLELTTAAKVVMVGGELQPLQSRQSALREKYRVVP
jgi:imidazolonepropionase-like amidohydrolase